MKAFFYSTALHWRQDLRNKGVIITYYLVPSVFYGFIGTIFTSINPEARNTLIESMTIFAVTMGAFLGTPIPLSEIYSNETKKAFKVGGIPLWTGAVNNFISAFVHLSVTSIIIYITAPFLFDAAMPVNPAAYFGTLALFIAVCLSIGTVLGLYIKGTAKLTMLSQILFLPSLMLSGIMFPVNLLPKSLQFAGNVFPATWGFRIMTASGPAFLNYLVLTVFLLLAVTAGTIRLLRIGID